MCETWCVDRALRHPHILCWNVCIASNYKNGSKVTLWGYIQQNITCAEPVIYEILQKNKTNNSNNADRFLIWCNWLLSSIFLTQLIYEQICRTVNLCRRTVGIGFFWELFITHIAMYLCLSFMFWEHLIKYAVLYFDEFFLMTCIE